MKRYEIIGEPIINSVCTFELIRREDGNLILFEDFENFIFSRIHELKRDVYIDGEHKRQRIKELKNLLK